MDLVITSSILTVLSLLCLPARAILLGQEGCSPSSCGSLDISYPFRLQGDPWQCGHPSYELLCEGDDTILSLNSAKYYVKEILYENNTLRLVDVSLASGSCRLPSLSFSTNEFSGTQSRYRRLGSKMASFLNCTKKVDNEDYKPIHCLSGNISTVYSVNGSDDEVHILEYSCSFITATPMSDIMGRQSYHDIFDALKEGFLVTWEHVLGQEGCSPSSCGSLDISNPFRLQGDPPQCGHPSYELLCEGNRTILSLDVVKYYVKEISYENNTLRLVDVSLASGPCRLPSLLSSYFFLSDGHMYYKILNSTPASFLNCSKKIDNEDYKPIHCLSGNSSTVYSVVGYDAAELLYLENSCSFITTTPMSYSMSFQAYHDIFDALNEGFLVKYWLPNFERPSPSTAEVIRTCWRSMIGGYEYLIGDQTISSFRSRSISLIALEINFLDCLNEGKGMYNHSYLTFNLVVAFIILLDIMVFLLVRPILARFVFAPISVLAFLAYKLGEMSTSLDNVEKFLRSQHSLTPTRYSYTDIISMTNNFKEKVGQGGFGSVFKGKLPGGPLVAVKMLGNSKCNGDEFISEVSTIGRIHHVNIVQLVGFCSEGSKRALIYEFMPNGSLDRYIFSNEANCQFTLEKLNEIALGVARGIDYLHQGCEMRILHFDIKPHNILLDRTFTPKVSDFGLAKLYPKDHSLVSVSTARGTIGYIAPELISRSFGIVSHKSDVYSFGMLLLEMAGRRRNVDPRAEQSSQIYFPSWIYDKLNPGDDQFEISETFEIDRLERKLCIVGLWCIQMRAKDRPSMSKVIEMLEADVNTLQMPPKPFLCSPQPAPNNESNLKSSTELSIIIEDK